MLPGDPHGFFTVAVGVVTSLVSICGSIFTQVYRDRILREQRAKEQADLLKYLVGAKDDVISAERARADAWKRTAQRWEGAAHVLAGDKSEKDDTGPPYP